jgi:SAM-dependent methyltransferase
MFEYLGTITPTRQLAWDCATGNGQAAVGLASVFDRVIATDASEKQIANAEQRDRVEYRVAPAEESGLESNSIDLIMVAQALHWFDLERFYDEVRRVLKPNGALAASAYRFFHITPEIDELVNHRYHDEIVGPFWPAERALIQKFEELPFPFHEIEAPHFEMKVEWNLDQLIGYLRSWSATQRFVATTGRNPLDEIGGDVEKAWGERQKTKRIVWPVTLRVGLKAT